MSNATTVCPYCGEGIEYRETADGLIRYHAATKLWGCWI